MYERILVPTDGSSPANPAVETAVGLSTRFEAMLDAIYVVETGETLPGLEAERNEAFAGRGEDAIQSVEETTSAAGVDASTTMVEVEGSVHATILAYADEHDVDCIVMGTNGRTGFDRFVLGSVAELTLRESPIPVMTVHEDTDIEMPFERVLVPTDGSDDAAAAVDHAIELCSQTGATLEALNVVDPTAIMAGVDTSLVWEALEEAGEQAVASVAEDATAAGVPSVVTAVRRGSPFRTIVDYADEQDVDCVVMGTRGNAGLTRYILGSVTERVVRYSDVPVISVHTESTE